MTQLATPRATLQVIADPADEIELLRSAARLSVDLNLPLVAPPHKPDADLLLVATPRRLELRVHRGDKELVKGKAVAADLESLDVTSSAGRSLKQPLARALGIKKRSDPPLTVIDATAGWGEDTWLMAALGCRVLAVERNPVLAMMLRDAIFRAGVEHPDLLARVHPVRTDARALLRRLVEARDSERADDLPAQVQAFLRPDVVYLDPMFEAGRKTAERKPMKVLRLLVGPDADSDALLAPALAAAARRVIVKRPSKAPPLAGQKPSTTYEGKGVRYDAYIRT
jgi:16S rRNA (guanine1516-N2)-methyltransferase